MTAPKAIVEARMRYKRCQDISTMARFIGLDVTPAKINRQFAIWDRWAQGRFATGYVIRVTGTRRIARTGGVQTDDQENG